MFFDLAQLNRYFLSAYCVPGAVLGIWDMLMTKTKHFNLQVTIDSLDFFPGFSLADRREFQFCPKQGNKHNILNYLPSNPMILLIL